MLRGGFRWKYFIKKVISEENREGRMKEIGWEERSKVMISNQVKLHPHLTGAVGGGEAVGWGSGFSGY